MSESQVSPTVRSSGEAAQAAGGAGVAAVAPRPGAAGALLLAGAIRRRHGERALAGARRPDAGAAHT